MKRIMIRLLPFLLAALLLVGGAAILVACSVGGEDTVTLYVYNWGEYQPPFTNRGFDEILRRFVRMLKTVPFT